MKNPHVFPNLYDFLSSVKHERDILNNIKNISDHMINNFPAKTYVQIPKGCETTSQ